MTHAESKKLIGMVLPKVLLAPRTPNPTPELNFREANISK
jgi:hypothetical protein